ncbi:isochorismatase family protein [Thauera linaloolentis]|uniref:Isochorismatase hydrolase n=1 Tax=Thauera linaloolentis (strain DSM 12138 / JCM 21573 / CCUG 41526 / CIP 105981 / IAM 15112 / NBRC 102519 / 47Lol) TaxID=1123367 RepID=N6ZED5_THAL4|nr:isochorismatase family protein [Thauera linaloolentis]ENO90539.1 isochorismatase hydrolase [Thauera linaloolentis 47Lol = DSM 12138]MCM8566398.1 isochorismatase family protein [Thauera linaloolentis]
MLMNREKSVLLIIDVQAKLAPFIHDNEKVEANCVWLARVAERMGVPVVVTEHFPDKIGGTLDSVRAATAGARYVGKQCFSAQADGCLAGTAVDQHRQVIMCGTEAHVCVQQTALDLRWAGKEVFIVAEAAGSRDPANRDLAFARMRGHGIEIVSREMVAFEWLQRGGTELFREVNRDFIR